MKKRLLAVLLACCMAAGMANAVFAADELPATAESAAAIAPADPDPPAPDPKVRRSRPRRLTRTPTLRRSRPRRLTPRQRPRPHAPS